MAISEKKKKRLEKLAEDIWPTVKKYLLINIFFYIIFLEFSLRKKSRVKILLHVSIINICQYSSILFKWSLLPRVILMNDLDKHWQYTNGFLIYIRKPLGYNKKKVNLYTYTCKYTVSFAVFFSEDDHSNSEKLSQLFSLRIVKAKLLKPEFFHWSIKVFNFSNSVSKRLKVFFKTIYWDVSGCSH